MNESALDRVCEKYGCAKVALDPKLHRFDECFGGKIRMGDIDGAVERNGHILWLEWKSAAILDVFEKQFSAQVRQARAFTTNNKKQVFLFVVGCPLLMRVDAFRVMYDGRWAREWELSGMDGLKSLIGRWFEHADSLEKLG